MATLISYQSRFEPTSPVDPVWNRVPAVAVATVATPQGMQTSEYIKKTYRDGEWGNIHQLSVKGWQTRHSLNLLLEFTSASDSRQLLGPDHFLDRVAVFFPSDKHTLFMTMGSPESPGILWSWRADGKAEVLEARGAGTIKALSAEGLKVQAERNGGAWKVLMSGPQVLVERRFALAVWSGAHQERGGLKAFSPQWVELDALE